MSIDFSAAKMAKAILDMHSGRKGTDPASDSFGTGVFNSLTDKYSETKLDSGVIVDFVSSCRTYQVLTGDRGYIWCGVGGYSANGPIGPRSLNTYPLGSRVLFRKHPDNPFVGTIESIDPVAIYSRENSISDYMWPVFRSGVFADIAHRQPIGRAVRFGELAGVVGGIDLHDMSEGKPVGATSAGEQGFISETGVGIYSDSWHAALRVDEQTGVWAFYPNQLLRVSGLNLQLWSSVEERSDIDDEGELQQVTRKCVYPWESYGLWYWNQITLLRELDASGQNAINFPWQLTQNGSGRASLDPELYDTISAARKYLFDGYLGQGGKESVAGPLQFAYSHPYAKEYLQNPIAAYETPSNPLWLPNTAYAIGEDGTVAAELDEYLEEGEEQTVPYLKPNDPDEVRVPPNNLTNPTGFQPGLFVENKQLTGAYHLASAKRIIIAKKASIPQPRQRRRPEDPDGDSRQGYGGYAPSGKGEPPDLHGPADRWAVHKVHGELPNMQEGRNAAAIADIMAYCFNWEALHPFAYHFNDWEVPEEGLAGSHLVNQAIPAFARLVCAQHLADPPQVKLDIDHRYGEVGYYPTEVVVALLDDGSYHVHDGYGNEFNCGPGGISLDSPADINIRAGRNINLWAGHDCVVRARDSVDVTTSAHDIRLASRRNTQIVAGTSGCGGILLESQAVCPGYKFTDSYGEEVNTSGIVMVAPHSQVVALSEDVVLKSLSGRIILDGGLDGTIRSIGKFHHQVIHETYVQMFTENNEVASANEFKKGSNSFGNNVTARGTIRATGGTGQATGSTATSIHSNNDKVIAYGDKVLEAESVPAEALLAEFTMRTDEEYMTYDWYIWRPRWMTLAEESGQTLPKWEEPTVKSRVQEFEQYPFPGGAWVASDSMRISDPYLSNPDRGWVAVERRPHPNTVNAAYENPTPPPVTTASLQDNYLVVVPNDTNMGSCGSNKVPTPPPSTFEAILQGGWGYPREGQEGNINALVTEGFWPYEIVGPPSPFEGELVGGGSIDSLAPPGNGDNE